MGVKLSSNDPSLQSQLTLPSSPAFNFCFQALHIETSPIVKGSLGWSTCVFHGQSKAQVSNTSAQGAGGARGRIELLKILR